jgi:heat shock protein HslJ
MRSIITALASAAAVILSACAGPSLAVSQPTLEGTAWTLKSITGVPVTGSAPTLRFEGGRASGSDGCNRYTTPVSIKGFAIEFGPRGAATQMACPEETMRQAQQFAAALTAARTYKMGAQELLLIDSNGQAVAAFAWQTQSLAGTRWKATSINNGRGAVVSLVKDSRLTLAFSSDGRVSGSAGCNQFNATYTQTREKITIAPPATTRKMCPDAAVMEQEAAFVKALASAATARWEGERLELRTADGALAALFVRDGA